MLVSVKILDEINAIGNGADVFDGHHVYARSRHILFLPNGNTIDGYHPDMDRVRRCFFYRKPHASRGADGGIGSNRQALDGSIGYCFDAGDRAVQCCAG